VRTLFLDLNHWIGLTKARVGHPDGARYLGAWESLRSGGDAGTLIVPLSAVHYQEMTGIKDVRQREALALTMGRLSRYTTLGARAVLLRAELLAAVSRWRGLPVAEPPAILGHGLAFAFGHPDDATPLGHLQLVGDKEQKQRFYRHGTAVVDRLEQIIGGGWTFDREATFTNDEDLITTAIREGGEFSVLRGARPQDIARLRAIGYRPETWQERVELITARERELADMLRDGVADHRQLDDIIAARLYVWELMPHFRAVEGSLGVRPEDILDGGKTVMTQLLDDMPTMQVEFALRRANFRNGSYRWTPNDIHDLAMLGTAVAYCDIVLTEKHGASRLNAAHIGDRYDTVILARVQELLEFLGTD
jgi:hypothetical protein